MYHWSGGHILRWPDGTARLCCCCTCSSLLAGGCPGDPGNGCASTMCVSLSGWAACLNINRNFTLTWCFDYFGVATRSWRFIQDIDQGGGAIDNITLELQCGCFTCAGESECVYRWLLYVNVARALPCVGVSQSFFINMTGECCPPTGDMDYCATPDPAYGTASLVATPCTGGGDAWI